MRLRIGLDFDNTLIDSSNSDYLIYEKTCQAIKVTPSTKQDYLFRRRKGQLIEFLDSSNINKSDYFETRNIIALNEEYLITDEIILDLQLFKQLQMKHDFFVISKRRDINLLKMQIQNLNVNFDLKNVFITFDVESDQFNSKEKFIKLLKLDYYVGDSSSDLESTSNTSTDFILVNTGFNKNISHDKNFDDINTFLKWLVNEHD